MKSNYILAILLMLCIIAVTIVFFKDLTAPSTALHSLSKSGRVVLYTVDYDGKNLHHLIYLDEDSTFTDEEMRNIECLQKHYIVRVSNNE